MKRVVSLCFALVAVASANPTLESADPGNVTTTGFCLCWESSEAATPRLRVFSDAGGTVEITNDVSITYQALIADQRKVASTPATRDRARAIQQAMTNRFVFLAKVSGLAPGTNYWAEAAVLDPVDETEDASDLLPIKTASRAKFLIESRQLIVDLEGAGDLTGSVVSLSNPTSPYPLFSVVGDGLAGSRAYLDLTHFLDAAGETQLDPASGSTLEMVVALKGAELLGGDFDGTDVAYDGSLTAASSSSATYQPPGVILVASPAQTTALAGFPLLVDFRAETPEGDLVGGFNSPLTLTSTGIDGGSLVTNPLTGGILTQQEVIFTTLGPQTASVSDPVTGAGTSFGVNVLEYNYDNFRIHYFGSTTDPAGDFQANGDGDLIPNMLEFAFGLNPLVLDSQLVLGGGGTSVVRRGGPVTTVVIGKTDVEFQVTYLRPRNHADLGISYAPRYSPDLQDWFVAPGTPTVLATDGELELVTFEYPLLTPDIRKARFFNLAVTIQ